MAGLAPELWGLIVGFLDPAEVVGMQVAASSPVLLDAVLGCSLWTRLDSGQTTSGVRSERFIAWQAGAAARRYMQRTRAWVLGPLAVTPVVAWAPLAMLVELDLSRTTQLQVGSAAADSACLQCRCSARTRPLTS
jgi:hypothetical protein